MIGSCWVLRSTSEKFRGELETCIILLRVKLNKFEMEQVIL